MAMRTANQATRLAYLPANAAYAFVFGDAPLRLEDEPLFFRSRREAIAAARRKGLSVDRRGRVTVAEFAPNPVVAAISAWHMLFEE